MKPTKPKIENEDRPGLSGIFRNKLPTLFESIGLFGSEKITQELARSELRDYVRNVFSRRITAENLIQLQTYWDSYMTELELSEDGKVAFAELNISPKDQEDFIASLQTKYGARFDEDAHSFIRKQLSLNITDGASPSECLHAFKLDGIINTSQLLTSATARLEASSYKPGKV